MDRKWWTLVAVCTGVFMLLLDVTIVNVALPAIQEQLHFSNSSLAWVVNAYLIAFGGLLLLSGRLGDLIGRVALADVDRLAAEAACLLEALGDEVAHDDDRGSEQLRRVRRRLSMRRTTSSTRHLRASIAIRTV